jgi:hypothetical protein
MTEKSYEDWMKEYREKCGEPALIGETENDRLIKNLKRMGLWERITSWKLKVRKLRKEGE